MAQEAAEAVVKGQYDGEEGTEVSKKNICLLKMYIHWASDSEARDQM